MAAGEAVRHFRERDARLPLGSEGSTATQLTALYHLSVIAGVVPLPPCRAAVEDADKYVKAMREAARRLRAE